MSCDVICLAMLYVYIKKTQTTKNKKTKNKNKKKQKKEDKTSFFFKYIFCHSFLYFVTHFLVSCIIR